MMHNDPHKTSAGMREYLDSLDCCKKPLQTWVCNKGHKRPLIFYRLLPYLIHSAIEHKII